MGMLAARWRPPRLLHTPPPPCATAPPTDRARWRSPPRPATPAACCAARAGVPDPGRARCDRPHVSPTVDQPDPAEHGVGEGHRDLVGQRAAPMTAADSEPVHGQRRHPGVLVNPARQAPQRPQLISNGTTTRSPTCTFATSLPTSSTSATHSCPMLSGSGNGVSPSASARSRSQVATAIGRTSAASGPGGGGAGTDRQLSRPPPDAIRARILGRLGWRRCWRPSRAAAMSRSRRAAASRSSAALPATAAAGDNSAAEHALGRCSTVGWPPASTSCARVGLVRI
jgi:hypothetical protein